jgi:ADP-ribosyl-[dinitrogen reductase] hydrolase
MRYGLLRHLYPDIAYSIAERIAGALTAYAYGDALGVPWEGQPPTEITAEEIKQLPTREGWPRGATSDDTALTLLVARHLAARDGAGNALAFLAELAEQAPTIRGLGPSTTAAIEHFRSNVEVAPSGGATNGAAMRALPVGWIIPHSQADRRRELAIEMSRATHADASAQVAACVVATCASWALEMAGPSLLLEVATEEAREAARVVGTTQRLAEMLTAVSENQWHAPPEGVSLDPYETVTAVMSCIEKEPTFRRMMAYAVRLVRQSEMVI